MSKEQIRQALAARPPEPVEPELQPTPARPGFYTERYPEDGALTISGAEGVGEQAGLGAGSRASTSSIRDVAAIIGGVLGERGRGRMKFRTYKTPYNRYWEIETAAGHLFSTTTFDLCFAGMAAVPVTMIAVMMIYALVMVYRAVPLPLFCVGGLLAAGAFLAMAIRYDGRGKR